MDSTTLLLTISKRKENITQLSIKKQQQQ